MRNFIMKQLLLIIVILIVSTTSIVGQILPEKENDTIIVWSKYRKLDWNDFQRSVHKETRGAQSDIGIDVLSIPTKNKDYKYVVLTYFYKLRSSTATTSPVVLKHEQLHFDIAELFARKMRIKIELLNKKKFDIDNYNNAIDAIYQNYYLYQEKFDKETGHSLVIENQKYWEEKIAAELKGTERFQSKIYND